MTKYTFNEVNAMLDEPDPAYVEFSIQDIGDQYIVTLFDPNTKEDYPGQCVVTHDGEIIFSDFSREMTNIILEELKLR